MEEYEETESKGGIVAQEEVVQADTNGVETDAVIKKRKRKEKSCALTNAKNLPQADGEESSKQERNVETNRGTWRFGLFSVFGILLWHFGVGVLLCLMTAVAVLLLFAAIFGLIFNGILGFIAIPSAVSYVTAAIASLVVIILFVYLFRRRIAKYDRRYIPIVKRKTNYERLWNRRIKRNKVANIYVFSDDAVGIFSTRRCLRRLCGIEILQVEPYRFDERFRLDGGGGMRYFGNYVVCLLVEFGVALFK